MPTGRNDSYGYYCWIDNLKMLESNRTFQLLQNPHSTVLKKRQLFPLEPPSMRNGAGPFLALAGTSSSFLQFAVLFSVQVRPGGQYSNLRLDGSPNLLTRLKA